MLLIGCRDEHFNWQWLFAMYRMPFRWRLSYFDTLKIGTYASSRNFFNSSWAPGTSVPLFYTYFGNYSQHFSIATDDCSIPKWAEMMGFETGINRKARERKYKNYILINNKRITIVYLTSQLYSKRMITWDTLYAIIKWLFVRSMSSLKSKTIAWQNNANDTDILLLRESLQIIYQSY